MTPLVSVGVPVYNGERYLRSCLDALLAQTLEDFELIVSDNASTDSTPEICREYAERDPRVRLIRSETNRGASWNHSEVARHARAPYFKWAASDDLCKPEFLERCVDVLEADRSAVLAQPRTLEIDERGEPMYPYRHRLRLASHDRLERWTDLLMIGYACYHVYGVIRMDALVQTRLMGTYIESDMVLLAELALHGRFAELDEELFLHRLHPEQSVSVFADRYDRGAWFDTRRGGLSFPTWRFAVEYARAVHRAPLTRAEARRCHAATVRWAQFRWRDFLRDLKAAARRIRAQRPASA